MFFWRKIDVGKRRSTVTNDNSDQNSDSGGGWFKCLKQVKRVNNEREKREKNIGFYNASKR